MKKTNFLLHHPTTKKLISYLGGVYAGPFVRNTLQIFLIRFGGIELGFMLGNFLPAILMPVGLYLVSEYKNTSLMAGLMLVNFFAFYYGSLQAILGYAFLRPLMIALNIAIRMFREKKNPLNKK